MKPYDLPDARGHFGPYGGVFVAETLMHALEELRDAYAKYQHDPDFVAEFRNELKHVEWKIRDGQVIGISDKHSSISLLYGHP